MSTERKLLGTADAAATEANYIEDCFSCYLYTGTGASQTITNGIDLATKGGMVWTKCRNVSINNRLQDTVRGLNNAITSNSTSASYLVDWTVSATSSGYINTPGIYSDDNQTGNTYASWTFRKQAKFFTICTWTGSGVARTISHDLGCVPGMILVKRTDTTSYWKVYHKYVAATPTDYWLHLNTTQAALTDGASTIWNSTSPTSSAFSLGTDADVNASGGTYVAYLFADSNSGGFGAAGTDSVVACGSLTPNNNEIVLGWEPQYLLLKKTNSTGGWFVIDNMRGFSTNEWKYVLANTSGAEASSSTIWPTARGFYWDASNSDTYIYLAIRRGPMKTPTDATKVFAPILPTDAANTIQSSGFPVDLILAKNRTGTYPPIVGSRLTGSTFMTTSSTDSETSWDYLRFDSNVGYNVTVSGSYFTAAAVNWLFRRAPGFFDVVCYTGDGNTGFRFFEHNLGVIPQLLIVKSRSGPGNWYVADSILYGYMFLNSTSASTLNPPSTGEIFASSSTLFGTTGQFNGNNVSGVNASGQTYVAYLFATCAGVSKVGSYTGNGSSQTINCGFASGARFVLIKRTDSTGDWYVWDTARGIVSANDQHLSLNTAAAEVTSDDTIDPDSTGFIVNQVSATNVNVSSATYIYLAIA